ncbi:hypothetical protein J6590_031808 [Homalodisca vitripennis]|nr:hypothetical protein J6590_031808 [Homalodisca vitripennis]
MDSTSMNLYLQYPGALIAKGWRCVGTNTFPLKGLEQKTQWRTSKPFVVTYSFLFIYCERWAAALLHDVHVLFFGVGHGNTDVLRGLLLDANKNE